MKKIRRMKSSTLLILTTAAILGVLALLTINYAPSLSSLPLKDTPLFPFEEVQGVAVVHKGLPYTLNFEQMQIAKSAILRAASIKMNDYRSRKTFDFEKIIFYRFNKPEVQVFPIQWDENNLVFSIPSLSTSDFFLELSSGDLQNMLQTSFDP